MDDRGGSLGDIMGMRPIPQTTTTVDTTTPDLLTTSIHTHESRRHHQQQQQQQSSTQQSLTERYGIDHPLDRVALTANGNLQRLVSSYYDAPVSVTIDSCQKRPAQTSSSSSSSSSSMLTPEIWDRSVHLQVYNQTFCTATSVITIHDALCQELVASGQVGLGQLFRFLDLLPEFTLLNAGPFCNSKTDQRVWNDEAVDSSFHTAANHNTDAGGGGGGGFWREYRLDCNELSCHIYEEFRPGMWHMTPRARKDQA